MEFYGKIPFESPDVDRIRRLLTLDKLPELCASIDSVTPHTANQGSLYCLWGGFDVSRTEIRCGVRFSLLDCPHALAWTITVSGQELVVHCTIDKTSVDPDFAESIQLFANDWAEGLGKALP